MKILLVDDEVELVTTLAERLSMRDIETDWATDARKALELAESNEYSIAILDVRIPGGIDGFQLKKLLEEKQPGMKFMFYTGLGTEEGDELLVDVQVVTGGDDVDRCHGQGCLLRDTATRNPMPENSRGRSLSAICSTGMPR